MKSETIESIKTPPIVLLIKVLYECACMHGSVVLADGALTGFSWKWRFQKLGLERKCNLSGIRSQRHWSGRMEFLSR